MPGAVGVPAVPGAGAVPEAGAAPPESRPVGIARGFEIVADSLDVVAPGGTLQTLRAVGRARGVSRPETEDGGPAPTQPTDPAVAAALTDHGIDPSILEDDWIEGDTIVATFAPVAAAPSAGGQASEARDYALEELVAIGNGRSIYRYPPESTTPDGTPLPRPDRSRWTINYVVASRITLTLVDGRVDGAEAEGSVVGGYLDPIPEVSAEAVGADAAVDASPADADAPADPPGDAP